jgi:YD repeat-containing protein
LAIALINASNPLSGGNRSLVWNAENQPSSITGPDGLQETYSYDANGNLLSGGGRTYTWTADNLPATISSGGVTENYTCNAANEPQRSWGPIGVRASFAGQVATIRPLRCGSMSFHGFRRRDVQLNAPTMMSLNAKPPSAVNSVCLDARRRTFK